MLQMILRMLQNRKENKWKSCVFLQRERRPNEANTSNVIISKSYVYLLSWNY